jgi:hypothetical protein
VRTGNISSLSERDWTGVRERRAFEQAERDEQLLAEDRAQYEQQYVRAVEEDQLRVAPAHRIAPIPFDAWRAYADPAINDPVIRGAAATNKALLLKVRSDEAVEAETERKQVREAVLVGRPDPSWKIPASAVGLKMTIEQATEYARKQAELFVEHNHDYFASAANFAATTKYLIGQNVTIPTEDCFKLAWLRLRELGLIEERPAPLLEPAPESQEPQPNADQLREQNRNEYRTKVVVTDPRTGQDYTEYQLDRLPADEYKRLMIGEFRTPRITDVIKPAWYRQ